MGVRGRGREERGLGKERGEGKEEKGTRDQGLLLALLEREGGMVCAYVLFG